MKNHLQIFIVVILILSIFLLSNIYVSKQNKLLKIIFLDVGQGDAIFIETPNGKQILIDAGPNGSVVRELSHFIPFYDRTLDLLIATHSDLDHVGGFPEIIKRFHINSFAKNSITDSDHLNTEIKDMLDNQKINQTVLNAGDKILLDSDNVIYLEILWPIKNNEIKDNNDNSIITRLVYDHVSIMLTGDASTEIEKVLIEIFSEIEDLEKASNSALRLKSQILKSGHHGSRTSTSEKFIQATDPEFVIISTEKDSRFGHPHVEVLENIEKFSQQRISESKKAVEILSTAEIGSIYFQSDGKNVWVK